MDGCALDLPSVCGIAAAAVGVVGAENFGDVAVFILVAAGAANQISTLQAAFGAVGIQALILGHGGLQKILGLYVELAGEGDHPGAVLGMTGIVLNLEGFSLARRIVGDGQGNGTSDGHDAHCGFVEILP